VLGSVTGRGYLRAVSTYAVAVDPRTRRMVTLGALGLTIVLVVVAAWLGRG
jgi:hypothetical protein